MPHILQSLHTHGRAWPETGIQAIEMALLFVGRFFSLPSSPARTRQSCRTASALRRRAGGKMHTAGPCETASSPPPKSLAFCLAFALPLPCRLWLSLPSILCQAGPGHGRPWARQALAGLPLEQQARPRQLSTLPSLSRLRACARPAEGVPPASRHHGLSPACFLCGAGTGRREARSLAGLSLPCPQAGWPLESHADINVKKTVRSKREPCQKDSHVKKIDASPEPPAPHVQKMDTAHTCLTPCG